ncbi:hypothetical protein pb186bvf_016785 [Paramecium bursaria]
MDYKLRNKLLQSYGNGMMFAILLGWFGAPFENHPIEITKDAYKIFKRQYYRQQILKFPFLPPLYELTQKLLDDQGFDKSIQVMGALGVGLLYLHIVKYK